MRIFKSLRRGGVAVRSIWRRKDTPSREMPGLSESRRILKEIEDKVVVNHRFTGFCGKPACDAFFMSRFFLRKTKKHFKTIAFFPSENGVPKKDAPKYEEYKSSLFRRLSRLTLGRLTKAKIKRIELAIAAIRAELEMASNHIRKESSTPEAMSQFPYKSELVRHAFLSFSRELKMHIEAIEEILAKSKS